MINKNFIKLLFMITHKIFQYFLVMFKITLKMDKALRRIHNKYFKEQFS